jgi:transposase
MMFTCGSSSSSFACPYTAADGVEMAEYGHAKDDDELPQVNISYAVNHKDATPLFYEMYPGSIIDNTQCTHMVDRAREYGYKNVGIILDRGYFSTANIRYFDKKGYDFLMMIKTRSILVRELIDEARLPLLTKTKYYLPEHEVYAMTKT